MFLKNYDPNARNEYRVSFIHDDPLLVDLTVTCTHAEMLHLASVLDMNVIDIAHKGRMLHVAGEGWWNNFDKTYEQ